MSMVFKCSTIYTLYVVLEVVCLTSVCMHKKDYKLLTLIITNMSKFERLQQYPSVFTSQMKTGRQEQKHCDIICILTRYMPHAHLHSTPS